MSHICKGLSIAILLILFQTSPLHSQFVDAVSEDTDSLHFQAFENELIATNSSEYYVEYSKVSESNANQGWDVSYLKQSDQTFRTSEHTSNARAMALVDSDSRLFIHARGSQNVVTYDLTIPGDISSAVFVNEFDTSPYLGTESEGANGHGFYIRKDDLGKVWLWNRTEIWQFDLSVPGDMSTATKSGYKSLRNKVSRGHDIAFRPDGKVFFVEDRVQEAVHQFHMSDPWNIESLVWEYTLDISDRHDEVRGIEFHPDGRIMYLLDTGLQELQQYTLSEPWKISTAQFEKVLSLSIRNPRGLTWNSNGSSAYVMNTSNGVITQFNTSTLPGSVQLVGPANNSIEISIPVQFDWQPYENADHYEIQISEYPDFSSYISENNYADTNYKISDLNNSTVYYWRVRFTIDQEHSTWSDVWSFETEASIPEVPTLKNEDGQQDASTTPRLEWNPANDAETYQLQLSNQSDFSKLILNEGSLSETWYEVTEALDYSTTYHWRVRAGNESGNSNWSESRSFNTKKRSLGDNFEEVFELKQNYPNPFNPTTQIRYSIKEQTRVKLEVYNLLGQRVAILVDENQRQGDYEVSFDASGLSSGVYFYRLNTGTFIQIRRMTLAK